MKNMFCGKLHSRVVAFSIIGIFLIGIIPMLPAFGAAVYCTNCATFHQQIKSHIEAVNTALNTAEQLKTQVQQYQHMIEQGISLPNSMFSSISSDLQEIAKIYERSKVLGRNIKDMGSDFDKEFPDFKSYLKRNNLDELSSEDYEKWSEYGRNNVKAALEAASISTSTFEQEDTQLARIVSRSQTAAGRMQAIQAGNEIAAQNVQQLQKLRNLLLTQTTMQANYMALQQDQQDRQMAADKQFWGAPIKKTGIGQGF